MFRCDLTANETARRQHGAMLHVALSSEGKMLGPLVLA